MHNPKTFSSGCQAFRPLLVIGCLITSSVHADYTVIEEPGFTPQPLSVVLPEMSQYQQAYIRAKLPVKRNGTARIELASQYLLLEEALRGERGDDLRQRQGSDEPRIITIDKGCMSLDQVVESVADSRVAENRDGVVTLHLPLLIAPGSGLIVDGAVTGTLRLSTDRGAFIANSGQLFVIDAHVTSWSVTTSQPSLFVDKRQFRPFVTSYVRSQTYLAGSTFAHLGFAAPSAYGLSLTSHPERNRGEPRNDWPTGILVDNEFRGLYYGFYSFEARDVGIVGNLYTDNIVYGIDPHDRSTRFVIARNRTTATMQRHGIIGSRGITDSFILDNESDHNTQAGIMLDRQCCRNVIWGNKVHQNGQGIAIYESSSNLVCKNLVALNTKSGVKVRNSCAVDIRENTIVGQGDYALDVSARRLDDHRQRAARGDTYEEQVEVFFVENRIRANRGLAKATQLGVLRLADIRRDVDLTTILSELQLPSPIVTDNDDADFGQELKPLADRLNRVFADQRLLVTIRGGAE